MTTVKVSLPDPLRWWAEDQVNGGPYGNMGDYVRELIRRDQKFQAGRETLIQALVAGEASGRSERTIAEIWKAVTGRHGLGV